MFPKGVLEQVQGLGKRSSNLAPALLGRRPPDKIAHAATIFSRCNTSSAMVDSL